MENCNDRNFKKYCNIYMSCFQPIFLTNSQPSRYSAHFFEKTRVCGRVGVSGFVWGSYLRFGKIGDSTTGVVLTVVSRG